MTHPPSKLVECTIPLFAVSDIQRSIAFYTQNLGFRVDWGGESTSSICSVSRDGCSIMLSSQFKQVTPAWVWIGLRNDSLFDQLRASGVKVVQEPKNYSWAYEMKFADPDGNVLWLGTESRTDLPLIDKKPL